MYHMSYITVQAYIGLRLRCYDNDYYHEDGLWVNNNLVISKNISLAVTVQRTISLFCMEHTWLPPEHSPAYLGHHILSRGEVLKTEVSYGAATHSIT